MNEYENLRRITYGDTGARFLPVCPKCGRFVKADDEMMFNDDDDFDREKSNAMCKKCGRVQMPFEGFL
jgi:hypothetical protein